MKTDLLARSAPRRAKAAPCCVQSSHAAAAARCVVIAAGLAIAASACKSRDGSGALAKAEPSEDAFANVPVPSADGPKLIVLRNGTPVFDRPSPEAKKLGELRAGAVVAR